ncbi:MAG: hypothetical protein WCE65_00800, partial [Methanoregula sp.]
NKLTEDTNPSFQPEKENNNPIPHSNNEISVLSESTRTEMTDANPNIEGIKTFEPSDENGKKETGDQTVDPEKPHLTLHKEDI